MRRLTAFVGVKMCKTVGYLGPEGSYSQLAANKMCPNCVKIAHDNFYLLMQSLKNGQTDAIILPIENTLNGGVLQNIDLLQYTDGVIAVRECSIKIDHRLITLKGADKSKITKIYSHQQAIAQCSKYITKNYPDARVITTPSTSGCIEMLKAPTDSGIVGAHFNLEGYELSSFSIADEESNCTHFLLVERGSASDCSPCKKIYFSFTCPHEPGALLKMLALISSLNMTKIESRPIRERAGEYRFFIEAEGDYSKNDVKEVINNLKARATSFKILGCY